MANKRILVVMGSPRKNGNSATLAREVIAGAEAVGAVVHSFHLNDMDIGPCTACDACCDRTAVDCVHDDDMRTLYPLLRETDALVIASPVYWFSVSAQTKLFMDRCYALEGETLADKRIGIILTYGGADPFSSGAINALRMFQDAFNYVGAEIVGMVYGSASEPGEIRHNETLMRKAFQLGQELVSEAPKDSQLSC